MNSSLLEQTKIIEDWVSQMEKNNKTFANFHKQVIQNCKFHRA